MSFFKILFIFPFMSLYNSPDVQRGANQGTSSVFTGLDITPRQWKELRYLIAGEEPLGALTVTGAWKESLSHSAPSPPAAVTTSRRPFTRRLPSIVKVDSARAPGSRIMWLLESLGSEGRESTRSTAFMPERFL